MTAVLDEAALIRDALLRELRDAGAVYVRVVPVGALVPSEYVRVHKGSFRALVRRHGPSVTYSATRGPDGSLYVG